ncbi:hypothetical protein PIB30_105579, partial [Stylosanthes scabra]|nr:hypothetical protein [Stylosanthes scabra]
MELVYELFVGVYEEEVIVDEWLPWNDAEEVDEALSLVVDVAGNNIAVTGRVEDGEVDIGVGVAAAQMVHV